MAGKISFQKVAIINRQIEGRIYSEPAQLLALGWLRYEALRRLNRRESDDLQARSIAGENFDDMVDDLIAKNPKFL